MPKIDMKENSLMMQKKLANLELLRVKHYELPENHPMKPLVMMAYNIVDEIRTKFQPKGILYKKDNTVELYFPVGKDSYMTFTLSDYNEEKKTFKNRICQMVQKYNPDGSYKCFSQQTSVEVWNEESIHKSNLMVIRFYQSAK